MEVSGYFHTLAALLWGKDSLVPSGQEDGWAPESGHCAEEKNPGAKDIWIALINCGNVLIL
jgi:hypothetical protein